MAVVPTFPGSFIEESLTPWADACPRTSLGAWRYVCIHSFSTVVRTPHRPREKCDAESRSHRLRLLGPEHRAEFLESPRLPRDRRVRHERPGAGSGPGSLSGRVTDGKSG